MPFNHDIWDANQLKIKKAICVLFVLTLHLLALYFVGTHWQVKRTEPQMAGTMEVELLRGAGAAAKPDEKQGRSAPRVPVKQRELPAGTGRAGSGDRPATGEPGVSPVHPRVETREDDGGDRDSNANAASLIDNALRSAGKVDKEIRQQLPRRFPDDSKDGRPSALERAVEAAGKIRTTTTEEITSADGTRMTKVTGPSGTYCVIRNSIGATAGIDTIQRGVPQRTVNCP
ncbi:MAG TPA: hypothetical protein VEC35_25230 [Noviherbaspirillum sp.]|nr:hypothetical protein [Noviherbaspirillum sp.]